MEHVAKITLETSLLDGKIYHRTSGPGLEKTEVTDVQNAQISAALVRLGWTPPGVDRDYIAALRGDLEELAEGRANLKKEVKQAFLDTSLQITQCGSRAEALLHRLNDFPSGQEKTFDRSVSGATQSTGAEAGSTIGSFAP